MFECPECRFRLFVPITRLGVSTLGLYDDHRFPGRCILAYHEHVEHFDLLAESAALALMSDVHRTARAIKAAVGADRVNIAVLGNAQAHLHVHLVPRKRAGDPIPNRSPWQHPEQPTGLSSAERADVIAKISSAIAALS